MSGLQSLTLTQSQLASSQPHTLILAFTITAGVPTQLLTSGKLPAIFGVAAGDFTQAAVNALLGSAGTDEIDTSVAFGSTAMGVDAFGFVLDCDGQVEDVLGLESTLYAVEQDNFVGKVTSLPDTLTEGLFITPAGNLAGRVIPTGLDAATGTLVIKIHFFSK